MTMMNNQEQNSKVKVEMMSFKSNLKKLNKIVSLISVMRKTVATNTVVQKRTVLLFHGRGSYVMSSKWKRPQKAVEG